MKSYGLFLGLLVAPCVGAESLTPTVEIGFSFGGLAHRTDAFLELRASEPIGQERLEVIKARITSHSGPVASILGVPLGKHHFLFEAEAESASKTNWLWWGLGAAAVGAAVVLGTDDDDDEEPQQEVNCDTFIGEQPDGEVGVDPSCVDAG